MGIKTYIVLLSIQSGLFWKVTLHSYSHIEVINEFKLLVKNYKISGLIRQVLKKNKYRLGCIIETILE